MTNGDKFKDVFGFGADGSRVIAVNSTWWDCDFQRGKPKTNAGKIRAMSNEELADFVAKALYGMLGGQPCLVGNGFEDCKNRWLSWLNQEVK